MKKILYFATAAMLLFSGCSKETPKPEDSISVNPTEKSFGPEGGSVEVTVKSSGDWLLDGDCEWASPSAVSGADGDVVTFTVSPNDKHEALSTVFTFISGDKKADFEIRVAEHALPVFKLTSDPKVTAICTESFFDVSIETDLKLKDITVKIDEAAASWIKFYAVEGGKYTFRVSPNGNETVRTGGVTLSADLCDDIRVEVSQNAKSKIVLAAQKYECKSEAGTVDVVVSETNIEFDAIVPQEFQSWISVKEIKGNTVTLSLTEAEERREGKIQVVAKDGTLTVEAEIVQLAPERGAKVTVVDGVESSWILYKEPWWPKFFNVYGNSFAYWNPTDYGTSPAYLFWKDTSESNVKGYVKEGFYGYIDMFEVKPIVGLRMRYHESRGDTSLKFSVSNDGENWTELGTFGDGTTNKENRYFKFEGLECRYFKYEPLGQNNEKLPIFLYNMMFYHL